MKKREREEKGHLRADERLQDDRRRLLDCVPRSRGVRIETLDDGLSDARQTRVEDERPPLGHERDELHRRVALRRAVRVEDVIRQRRHEQWGIGRGDLERRCPSASSEGSRKRLLHRKLEEGPQDLHGVDVMLPDLKAGRAEVDSKKAVRRVDVMEVARNGVRDIFEKRW